MALTYKTRQFFRRLFRTLLILVLAALLVLLCWVLWLRRFIVYTADGVHLDFSLSQEWPLGQTGQTATQATHPDIFFTQTTAPSTPPPTEEDFVPDFEGFYVTLEELQNEREDVLQRILNLPAGTPVMLDVKSYWGYFFYSSNCGKGSGSFDMATMDAFFAAVTESGVYTIARLPAFRDYAFAEANTGCGLKESRGYLWVDPDRCYWLDPGSDGTHDHLVRIIRELRDLGFDEVAFTDFCFPDTDQVVYTNDKADTIAKAALALVMGCATDQFAVSFITNNPQFPLPEGNCRLYLQDVSAVDVHTILGQMNPETVKRTVFFTITKDTRYETCGVIRPLKMAEFE